jgi:hypothetical protein
VDNYGKLGSGMLLLKVTIAVVRACEMAATLRIRTLGDCPGTVDRPVVPFAVFV